MWEDHIKMDLKEIDINMKNSVDSAQDREHWSPRECGIELPGSISHVVKWSVYVDFIHCKYEFYLYISQSS